MKKLTFLFLFLITGTVFPQEAKKEEIAKKLEDYFFLERENIHVHTDKDIFITDEKIWFKGYVYHRKANRPFYATVNVFATLQDASGKVLDTQLVFGNFGIFSGSFTLPEDIAAGKYYLQFYTNWMNNFSEDESFVKEVRIINKNAPAALLDKRDLSVINIAINPEGGKLIAGISNNVGISVTDCNHKPVAAKEAKLVSESGEVIKSVPLNSNGYGKFEYTPETGKNYTIKLALNDSEYTQPLPPLQVNGIGVEVNSFATPGKTIIKLRASQGYRDNLANKPLFVVIHKDDKAAIYDISFTQKESEKLIVAENKDLPEGLNTLRVIDASLNELAQRLFYIYPEQTATTATDLVYTKDAHGNVEVKGNTHHPNMNLSIAMLPADSRSLTGSDDISGSLKLAPYIKNGCAAPVAQAINIKSRPNQYELDLLLLNSENKYNWNNIVNNPPKSTYPFDIGLSLKGTINQNIPGLDKYRVRVFSPLSQIDEYVDITNNNEVYLDHLILGDSTKLEFMLVKGEEKKQIKLYPQIFNNRRNYNFKYQPDTKCPIPNDGKKISLELPDHFANANAIMLDEVKIEEDPNKLKYKKAFGNSQLRAYKITDFESHNFFYVTDLIRYHGFNVETNGVNVSITGRRKTTINGQATTPMIYIDNMILMSFDQLFMMQTADVDEFYVNPVAVFPSVDNREGIIKLYMKKGVGLKSKVSDPTSFMLTDGFSFIEPFKNSQYLSTATAGFQNFGLIGWEPIIATDEKGEFKFDLPYNQEEAVKIIIEGVGPDGSVISEIKTLYFNK